MGINMNIVKKVLVVLLALMLSGCSTIPTVTDPATVPTVTDPTTVPATTTNPYPYDYTDPSFFEIENCLNYAPKATLLGVLGDKVPFDIKSTKDGYTVAQGACSDGTYGYFLQANTTAKIGDTFKEACKIIKVDMRTWEIVQESDPLDVCHGNGMGYNSKTHKLVVSHNKPEFKKVSVLTLKHCRWNGWSR